MATKSFSRQRLILAGRTLVLVAIAVLVTQCVATAEQRVKTASTNVQFDSLPLGWVMRGQTVGPFAVSENGRSAIMTADMIDFTGSLPRDLAQSSLYRGAAEHHYNYDRVFEETIAFNDDGLHDGFVARDKYTQESFYVIDGKEQARGNAAIDLAFGPDGSHAFVLNQDGRCTLYRDGSPTSLTAPLLHGPTFSPDGKHLAVIAAPRDHLQQVILDGELILERADTCSRLIVSNNGRAMFHYMLDGEHYHFDGTKSCGPFRDVRQMHTTNDHNRLGFIASREKVGSFVIIDGKESKRTYSLTFPPIWSPSGEQFAYTALDIHDETMDVHLVVDGDEIRNWRSQTPGKFEITTKPVYSAKNNYFVAVSKDDAPNYRTVLFRNGKPIKDVMPIHAFSDSLVVSPFDEAVAVLGEEVAEGPQSFWVDGVKSDVYELVNDFQFADRSSDYVFVGVDKSKTWIISSRATYGPYDSLLALPNISADGNAVAWVAVEDGNAFLCLNGKKSKAYKCTLLGATVHMSDEGTASCYMIDKDTGDELWVENAIATWAP